MTCGGGGTVNKCGCAATSFMNDVLPIFANNCAGCHGGSGGLFLDAVSAYANLVNVPTGCGGGSLRVVPGSVARSQLVSRITGVGICGGGAQMPLGGSLQQSEIDTISAWICNGAPNN